MKDCTVDKVVRDELNFETLKITNKSSYSSVTSCFRSMTNKAPSSTFSSVILDKKKGVKRKLDFDADSSDEDSSVRRENGKRRCLGDFRIGQSSFVDTDSNPLSPSKNRRSVASYSRSSISSSCRRRLFPYDRKVEGKELQSPLQQPKHNSEQNEVKLSLKKKFPGVPNSDSARSGLLLNLAFSKYNLPNVVSSGKKSNVSYDFVDQASVNNTTTKKEHIHYTSIEKDNSTFSKSPVFTAIKKVKRRLNLEEHESDISSNATTQCVSKEETCPKNTDGPKLALDISTSTRRVAKNIERDGELPVNSTNVNQNSLGQFPLSSTNVKKPQSNNNDLFKNSRLRQSLRDKIFDLSTFTADGSNPVPEVDVSTDRNSTEVDGGRTWRAIHRSFDERNSSAMSSCNQKRKPKYDRIVVRQDLVERAKRDAERLKRQSLLRSESLNIQKVSRRSSTGRSSLENSRDSVSKSARCKVRSQSSFIDAHIQRFLKDCSEMAKLRLESDKEFDENESHPTQREETQLSQEFDNQHSVSCNVLGGIEDPEPVIDGARSRNPSHPVIEDANTQEVERHKDESEFTIEHVRSQEQDDKSTSTLIFDDSFNDDDLGEADHKQNISFVSSSGQIDVEKLDHKVEEVLTQESEFEPMDSNFLQCDYQVESMQENTDDSAVKKYPLKKRGFDTLCGRLQMLVKREKSEARIWEYELSKKEVTSGVDTSPNPDSPVKFYVEKMWKEFSRLIVLCARVDSDPSDEFFKNNLKDIGTNVSHSVVLIIEPELFPKSVTHRSIFRIHPPWNILYSAALNLQVIFRPTKVEIISPNGNPLSCSDSTLPLRPKIVERNYFCYCNKVCDCTLPKQYETVIPCLLSLLSNFNGPTSLKSCLQDDVRTITGIDDLIAMYRLLYTQLHLEFEVLSIDSVFDKAVFWYIIGSNDRAEVCCVLVKDKTENLSSIRTRMKVRFSDVIPWKTIPPRLAPVFASQLNLNETDLLSKLDTKDLHLLVLSARYGKIDLV